MIDKQKIHKMVEYIKQYDFEFEIDEVIQNMEGILAEYGFVDIELSQDEFLQLMTDLLPLAEKFEFSEASHLALQEDPLIAQLPERSFSLKIEVIERKLARQNSRVSTSDFMRSLAIV